MKILVLGNAPWNNQNSVGNTLSNWFENWKDCDFAFMYNRNTRNENNCCFTYFQVTFSNIIHNIFTPWRIGKEFHTYDNNIMQKTTESTKINSLSGYKRRILEFCYDQLYSSNIWFNNNAKQFIQDFNPDIVFLFTIPDAFRYSLAKYIKNNTNAKIVQFIADDVYGQSLKSNSLLKKIYRKRIYKLLTISDKVYGASVQLCDAYQKQFLIDVSPLYKGCDIQYYDYVFHNPIKIIYAGNLHFGREKALIELVKIIADINKDKFCFELSIYSNSYISDEIRSSLNNNYGCHLYPTQPYSEIKKMMSQSDIVLHVESFIEEQKQLVRYSFSTKIIDCLQSGSVFMAIGPDGIASIEYSKMIPGAIVINNLSNLKKTLFAIKENLINLKESANQIREYAKTHHEITGVRRHLHEDFTRLLKNKG